MLSISVFIGLACLWDNDTIEMETKQFPDTLDLITGNFLRHSQEYYQWKIVDRNEKIKHHPDSLELYDDLAVSYSKIGKDSLAIQLMLKKDSISPGMYTTMANLGTFYIHHGDSRTGKKYIEKAIEINPDAHFGREVIQLELVKYALNKRDKGVTGLPLCEETPVWYYGRRKQNNPFNFYKHLVKTNIKVSEGVKGVEGMLRFGNFDSPVLLEALGDVLLEDNGGRNVNPPRNLATMAYLKAGMEAPKYSKLYREKAGVAFEAVGDSKGKFKKVTEVLEEGIQRGQENFARIRANEIYWIISGINPEEEYRKHYYNNESKTRLSFVAKGSESHYFLEEDSVSVDLLTYLDQLKHPPVIDSIDIEMTVLDTKDKIKNHEHTTKKQKSLFWLLIGIAAMICILLVVLAIIRSRR